MDSNSKRFQLLPTVVFVAVFSSAEIVDVGAQQQSVSPLGEAEKRDCQAVYAVASVRTVVECPAGKGYNLCFTRELKDRANLISGQMTYSGDMKSIPHPHNADISFIAAPVTIRTADGVLELEDHAVFSTETPEFAGIDTVTGGTGKFEGYSGKLMVLGYQKGKSVWMGTLCRE